MKMQAKIHRFFLFYGFWIAVLFGFLLGGILNLKIFHQSIWLIATGILIFSAIIVSRRFCLILMILAGIIISLNRIANLNLEKQSFSKYIGETHNITGIISEDIDESENGSAKIRLNIKTIDANPAKGTLFITLSRKITARRSDEITVKGKISAGFGNFIGAVFRADIVKITPKNDIVRDTRDWFSNKIKQFIPSPQIELGLGYLLGQKNSLPSTLDEALRITALSHIVVASGYNLTVLVRFCRRLFSRLSKKLAAFMAGILVIGFVLVVGFSPSMTRAGIVALLSLAAWYFGRKTQPLFLLIFIAGLTLIISPANLFNLGWQLSFASFFGVMILSPILKLYFVEDPEKLPALAQIFFETFSAQIATLPLIIITFKSFSIISIFANLAVLPFVPIAMLLTFLTGVGAIIFAPLGYIFGWAANLVLSYSVQAIYFFAKIPGAQFQIDASPSMVIFAYILLILTSIYLYKKTTQKQEKRKLYQNQNIIY